MGTGASLSLPPEQELQIYRELRAEYESCRRGGHHDEKELYERLRLRYDELTMKAQGKDSASADRQPSDKGEKDTAQAKSPAAGSGAGFKELTAFVPTIYVGDIVRCRLPGMHLYFEGLVVEDYYDGTYLVDFGNDEELEHVHGKDMQKVLSWDELELKDHVQVKDATMNIYSNAVIVAIHTEGTYDVLHDGEDEVEQHVPRSRIRKIKSNRSKASQRWQLLANTYKAFGLGSKLLSKKSSSGVTDGLDSTAALLKSKAVPAGK